VELSGEICFSDFSGFWIKLDFGSFKEPSLENADGLVMGLAGVVEVELLGLTRGLLTTYFLIKSTLTSLVKVLGFPRLDFNLSADSLHFLASSC